MTKVVVVYHSGYGHTKAVAEHVAKGASGVAGVTVSVVPVEELPAPGKDRSLGGRWEELAQADAIIFGAPTYMGSASAPFKEFMDRSSGVWFAQGWKDKLAAGFTNSGGLSGDKLSTLTQMAVFAGQHGMVWVSCGVWPSGLSGDGKGHNRLGCWLGLMTQADNAPPDATPPREDRETAEAFGGRVAQAARRWAGGKR